jgi:hypothetical protein
MPLKNPRIVMSIPCKFERSILSFDEHQIIMQSHHPEIYDVGLDDLKALRQRLRDMRDKERTLAREKRRAVRGKGALRGGSFPGTPSSRFSASRCLPRRSNA